AMITVYPHNRDWDRMAQALGDPSWSADNMRGYFEKLEACGYARQEAGNPGRHGFAGWLGTQQADPAQAVGDPQLLKLIVSAAVSTMKDLLLQDLHNDPLAVLQRLLSNVPSDAVQALLGNGGDALAALQQLL